MTNSIFYKNAFKINVQYISFLILFAIFFNGYSQSAPKRGFEGILTETGTTQFNSFEQLENKFTGEILPVSLGGNWYYINTKRLNNDRYAETFLKAYYNDIDQDLYNPSKTKKEVVVDPMDDFTNKLDIEAQRLGRPVVTDEEQLLVFDPNVFYLFMDKDGDDEDIITIRKRTPTKTVLNLTAADVRYKVKKDAKNNTWYLEVYEYDTSVEKQFRILKMTNDELLLADEKYKEIHQFNRIGIHPETN